jgi:hypothetical protein
MWGQTRSGTCGIKQTREERLLGETLGPPYVQQENLCPLGKAYDHLEKTYIHVKKPTLFFFHKYLGGNRLEYSHKIPKFWL